VIAIFTKFDGLVTMAFNEFCNLSIDEAQKRGEQARETLNTNLIEPLMATKFRPSDHVQLGDMQNKSSNCTDLIEKTANTLSNDILKLLFVSVQQNNIGLCIRHALQMLQDHKVLQDIIPCILAWFPHIWTKTEYDKAVCVYFTSSILLDFPNQPVLWCWISTV